MIMLKHINKYIDHLKRILLRLFLFITRYFLPDYLYLKLQYRVKTGNRLNLKNPLLYNEKIQWLKLHDRQACYHNIADKYEVRKYVADTIGKEYLIPIYGVWNNFDEIPIDTLPDQFVLKCTHDSGSVKICHDKQSFDIKNNRKFFKNRLSKSYYWQKREWAYKKIKPRIIAEKLMIDESGNELKDYKIFCFNGEPKIILVDIDKFTTNKRNFYSPEWEFQPLINGAPNAPPQSIHKPANLELMLNLAKKLSYSIIHVRVDLYNINEKVYFGELTFYDSSGYNIYEPPEWNRILGNWMTLPIEQRIKQ
jgi:hypothetical protein